MLIIVLADINKSLNQLQAKGMFGWAWNSGCAVKKKKSNNLTTKSKKKQLGS